MPDEGVPRRVLALVTIIVIAVAGGWHVIQHHEKDLTFYAPPPTVQSMAFATWLADGCRALPAWRIDIAGKNTPLFVGTIEVEHRRQLTWLITAAGDTGDYDRPQEALTRMLGDRFALKAVSRTADAINVNHEQRRLHRQGKVILVWDCRPP